VAAAPVAPVVVAVPLGASLVDGAVPHAEPTPGEATVQVPSGSKRAAEDAFATQPVHAVDPPLGAASPAQREVAPTSEPSSSGAAAGCGNCLQLVARNREVEFLRRNRELELELEAQRLIGRNQELGLELEMQQLAARNRELELELEVQRLAARNRELDLQTKVPKMEVTILRDAESEGARWCAPSVQFAPAG
jgi:hypothetical protein